MSCEPDLSVIIVNYNSGAYLQRCIASLSAAVAGIAFEVVVVDNGSEDGSTEFLKPHPGKPQIRLVEPRANLGFGAGCNLGASHARGRWLHFLNPDTQVGPDIDKLYLQLVEGEPERSIVVTRLLDERGERIKSWHLVPTIRNYALAVLRPKRARVWYHGASVIMTKRLFDELQGWATYNHMYVEDMDLFYKASRAQIDVCLSEVSVRHVGHGCSSGLYDERERLLRVERATIRFYRQHGMIAQYYVLTPMQIIRQGVRSFSEGYCRVRAFIGAMR